MSGTTAQLCEKSLERVVKYDPLTSPLILYPLTQSNQHPATDQGFSDISGYFTMGDVDPGWLTWISGE